MWTGTPPPAPFPLSPRTASGLLPSASAPLSPRPLASGSAAGTFFGYSPPPGAAALETLRGLFRLFCSSSPLVGRRPAAAAASAAAAAAPADALIARGMTFARPFLAIAHVYLSEEHPRARAHWRTSRCPLVYNFCSVAVLSWAR